VDWEKRRGRIFREKVERNIFPKPRERSEMESEIFGAQTYLYTPLWEIT
jgi:hypothetical protein